MASTHEIYLARVQAVQTACAALQVGLGPKLSAVEAQQLQQISNDAATLLSALQAAIGGVPAWTFPGGFAEFASAISNLEARIQGLDLALAKKYGTSPIFQKIKDQLVPQGLLDKIGGLVTIVVVGIGIYYVGKLLTSSDRISPERLPRYMR